MSVAPVDCEQSLFFFRFKEGSARARIARNEGGNLSLNQPLTRLAPPVTRVVICVSRAFCSMDQEKREIARSLVVLRTVGLLLI